jgi:hypothetical protein
MTDEELEKMAVHVMYEVDEFRKAIQKLPLLEESEREWNPTLESALLHFRVLRAFFLGEKRGNDDVLAKHYVANWSAKTESVFETTREDINKRLAHLTTGRLDTAFSWPLDDMRSAIENCISAFKRGLVEPRRSWFADLGDAQVIRVFTRIDYRTDSG